MASLSEQAAPASKGLHQGRSDALLEAPMVKREALGSSSHDCCVL